MVMHIKFQSQPCITIHHTCHETLVGSSCCKMPEPVQTHLILVLKVGMCHQAKFFPSHDSKTGCGDRIADSRSQSQPCLPIHHTKYEALEGSSCGELLESLQTHLILV